MIDERLGVVHPAAMPHRFALFLLLLVAISCGAPPAPPIAPGPVAMVPVAAAAPTAAPAVEPEEIDTGDPGPIPVTSADPSWGRRDALVTLVEFSDFQCPFCSRLNATLAELRRNYGPEQLRIVWKNNPLPFHKEARPSALVAMSLFERRGNAGFWEVHDGLFANQMRLPEAGEEMAGRTGTTTVDELRASASWARAEAKIDADIALGKAIGVTGTPASYINGVFLSGAQPLEKFTAVIDEQLGVARSMIAKGTPRGRVYAEATTLARARAAAAPPPSSAPPKDDLATNFVPLGKAPVRGKATALVTIVEFSEFQCPFCSRVAPTLQQVQREYGDKVRLVWKHNPLPFHPRAMPAAQLAFEARTQKGDLGFWAAHDLLFSDQQHLEDADLLADAKTLGLDVGRVQAAIASKKYAAPINEDQDLADDLHANGTPHFFINGRRLVGAQPIEKFRSLIDEELAKAEALVKGGVAPGKVYEKIMATAKRPDPPEHKTVPAPTAANPGRGPARAKVVVQMFSDFQCPFCRRVTSTIDELEKTFPSQIRLVWRNRPLPMHRDAEPAAEAAMEAFAQQGEKGFWAMYELLFSSQAQLDRASLDRYAAQLGLDMTRFGLALDTKAHQAEIDADAKVADSAGITGTPAFVINGYFVSGAQPIGKFKKIVTLALSGK